MNQKHFLKAVVLTTLGLGLMVGITSHLNQPAALAQSKKAKVVYNMKNPTIRLKVSKGYIWSNRFLTQAKYHAKNYKNEMFYSSRHATIKKPNGKEANYWLISNKSGSVKGWIWDRNTKRLDS
ncbi:hypothetical protein [Lentilactobacillus hilgardii]|uniref:D-alanyl-D-alanine carboxypeptidase n=1 Tax=Lentilactobacillus hilgardii TaxID=1588 RepID=A0A6P1E6G8_LENHI|nr:hypothetical protein [Lentilactobacillus hilgardii]EEI71802.1 hypothetical protein HMPREF0496_0946 [Lentilactobacillus hilgardii ATCC 27305]MCT3393193.1 hypothetical protein [Lentilactobacillus hilgardii]QHB51342.1 hypothetical protein GQR93_03455 [Lentilactobacillus hilgardii]RRG10358.1 MAG: hypothetical protein DUD35_08130 [Lactobacillus sp.]